MASKKMPRYTGRAGKNQPPPMPSPTNMLFSADRPLLDPYSAAVGMRPTGPRAGRMMPQFSPGLPSGSQQFFPGPRGAAGPGGAAGDRFTPWTQTAPRQAAMKHTQRRSKEQKK